MSADPLAVHVPASADLNVYAYVSGGVLMLVDPVGLDFFDALAQSFRQGEFGPGSPIANELVYGDYPTLQNDAALKRMQDTTLALTAGAVAGIATAGTATALGAGMVTTSTVATVAAGAQTRMTQTALAGGSPKEQVVAAVEPKAVGTDAALGAGMGVAVKVAAPVIARVAERSVKPPSAPTMAELEALEVEATKTLKGPAATADVAEEIYGPYAHEVNKANTLEKILDEKQLISTQAKVVGGGSDAVRARAIPLEKIDSKKPVIEFYAKEKGSVHPTNKEVSWSKPEGERLDIEVSRVKHPDGTIETKK